MGITSKNNRRYRYYPLWIIIAFIGIAGLFVLGVYSIICNNQGFFKKIEYKLANKESIVINEKTDKEDLSLLLIKSGYFHSEQSARFASSWIIRHTNGSSLTHLGALLNQNIVPHVPLDTIRLNGGDDYNARADYLIKSIGHDNEWENQHHNLSLNSTLGEESDSTESIKVKVYSNESTRFNRKPLSNVIVRLTEYWYVDTISPEGFPKSVRARTIGYAKTDKKGEVCFNVQKRGFYSVLPIMDNSMFGSPKGTNKRGLDKELQFEFIQNPIELPAISKSFFANLKSSNKLICRTPNDFVSTLWNDCYIFLGAWFFVVLSSFLIDVIKSHKNHNTKRCDYMILLILMALNVFGILILWGHSQPLSDRLYGHTMVIYSAIGCILLVILSCIPYLKLFNWYRQLTGNTVNFGNSIIKRLSPSYPFIIFAVVLLVSLYFFGKRIDGSDAKIQLLFFQPSEIVKYLIVIFLAIAFYIEAPNVKRFANAENKKGRKKHLQITGIILSLIILISLIYMKLLSDIGPALVILGTFIFLYTVVRGDGKEFMVGTLSFVVIYILTSLLFNDTWCRIGGVIIWLIGWLLWCKIKKRIYESSLFFNSLLSVFLIGGEILKHLPQMESIADKLLYRTNMTWNGIFDNHVPQGDQVAQSIWGLAEGGIKGLGLGNGAGYLIPAGHTDLILSSIGEQTGWIGIVSVLTLFFILIKRTFKVGLYSGNYFTFYLILAIGTLISCQFFLISLGSIGLVPLTGITFPFLSYSGTGIIMILAIYGIVVSVSRYPGNKKALESFIIKAKYRNQNAQKDAKKLNDYINYGKWISVGLLLSIATTTFYYQVLKRNQTLLRAAITSTKNGEMVLSYNPRIEKILSLIERGNIYDRKGMLLATSDYNTAKSIKRNNVVDTCYLINHVKRYYPFGNHLVLMVGDIEKQNIFSNFTDFPIGYFAEDKFSTQLKGIKVSARDTLILSSYSSNKFLLPMDSIKFKNTIYDFQPILNALKEPIQNNSFITTINETKSDRDIHLTVDAQLQTQLQDNISKTLRAMRDSLKENHPGQKQINLTDVRASIVIVDAKHGDLLASANYPLPHPDSILKIRNLNLESQYSVPSERILGSTITERDLGITYSTPPGSTAKIMTAMADFKKKGVVAYDRGFLIKPYMTVEPSSVEPNITLKRKNRNYGDITFMENAIKHSSNAYFIMLLCEDSLYSELKEIYLKIGTSLSGIASYFYDQRELTDSIRLKSFVNTLILHRKKGLEAYHRYMKSKGCLPVNTNWSRNNNRLSSIQEYTGIAWGQSKLEATPLAMARVAATIGNRGIFVPTRYILDDTLTNDKAEFIIDIESSDKLASAMNGEASRWTNTLLPGFLVENQLIGGKTGTPERFYKGEKCNDAWYICFLKDNVENCYGVAIRLERWKGRNSKDAVDVLRRLILPTMIENHYLKF